MKHSVSVLIGASSLFLGCTKAFNFDDQERMLQRARDMNDSTPMTEDEAKRLRSMLDRGLLKIVDKPSNRVSEAKADKNSIPRALKSSKSERHKKNIDIPRGSGARTSTARGKKPERGERKAPTDAKRSKTEKVSHRKKDTDSLGTESSPKASRNKPKKGGRHDESYNYEIAIPYDDQLGDDYYYGDDNYYGDDATIYYDDSLPYGDDEVFAGGGGGGGGGGLNYVFMFLEGFQDGRSLAGGIPPNPARPDEFDAGTTYLFNKEAIYGVIHDSFSGNSTTGILVDESDIFADVTGKCIRTDPHDELDSANYVGRAYCQFVYTISGSITDALTAEGPIQIGEDAVLSVTGGLGIYRRTVGQIFLTPVDAAALSSSPPSIEFSYELDLPSSYYMQAYIYMDQSLIPAEVFY